VKIPKFNNPIFFVIVLMLLFLILVLPSVIHTQTPEQQQATQQQNNLQSQKATASSIFNNNLIVSLISLIPIVGWGYLIAVLWNTGVVVASYGQPWYWIFNNVFAWIELAVYSYVVLQSWKLYHLIPQRKCNDFKVTFTKTVAYTLIITTVVLMLSALLEYALISRMLSI
jgi:hypothetical protein